MSKPAEKPAKPPIGERIKRYIGYESPLAITKEIAAQTYEKAKSGTAERRINEFRDVLRLSEIASLEELEKRYRVLRLQGYFYLLCILYTLYMTLDAAALFFVDVSLHAAIPSLLMSASLLVAASAFYVRTTYSSAWFRHCRIIGFWDWVSMVLSDPKELLIPAIDKTKYKGLLRARG